MRAVELEGVGCGDHRGQIAGGVPAITSLLGEQDFLQVADLAARRHFALAAVRPLDRVGHEEEFTVGARKDNGALIAAFADDVSAGGDGSLQLDQAAADHRTVGDRCRGCGNLGGADQVGDVLAVEHDAVGGHLQAEVGQQSGQSVLVVQVDAGAQTSERDRPVHGASVEEIEAEPPGQFTGGTTLASACRAVDGDNHASSPLAAWRGGSIGKISAETP